MYVNMYVCIYIYREREYANIMGNLGIQLFSTELGVFCQTIAIYDNIITSAIYCSSIYMLEE